MKLPVVIGFGNPLRGDDGIGWRAAELVEARRADAEVIACHQLTPELADRLGDATLAIFLDASIAQEPGTVRVEPLAPVEYRGGSHHLTPAQLLGLAERLKRRVCPAALITAGAFSMDVSERTSGVCEPCVTQMADIAMNMVKQATNLRMRSRTCAPLSSVSAI